MKWSVCIPTFRPKPYIDKAIESVQEQLKLGDDAELIVLQNPAEIECEFESKYLRNKSDCIRHIVHSKNIGAIGNWNACIEASRGEFVHILHDDDYVLSGFYEVMQDALMRNESIGAAVCRSLIIDEAGELDEVTPRLKHYECGSREAKYLLPHNPIRCPSVVVRKSFYDKHGCFDENIAFASDWEMWIRICKEEGLLSVNKILTAYRLHASNFTTKTQASNRDLFDYLALFKKLVSTGVAFDEPAFLSALSNLTRDRLGNPNLSQSDAESLQQLLHAMTREQTFWERSKWFARCTLQVLGMFQLERRIRKSPLEIVRRTTH